MLPVAQRVAVVLVDVQGWPVAEVAGDAGGAGGHGEEPLRPRPGPAGGAARPPAGRRTDDRAGPAHAPRPACRALAELDAGPVRAAAAAEVAGRGAGRPARRPRCSRALAATRAELAARSAATGGCPALRSAARWTAGASGRAHRAAARPHGAARSRPARRWPRHARDPRRRRPAASGGGRCRPRGARRPGCIAALVLACWPPGCAAPRSSAAHRADRAGTAGRSAWAAPTSARWPTRPAGGCLRAAARPGRPGRPLLGGRRVDLAGRPACCWCSPPASAACLARGGRRPGLRPGRRHPARPRSRR